MADTTIDLLKNSSYVGKMDELIAAVKSGGGTASDVEWDNVKNKPTTIGGYGIIDAKIDNGTITLGNQTITPLTSAPVTSVNSKTGAVVLGASDVGALPADTVIPTVNNATLTIRRNSVDVGSFTANSAEDVNIDINVPTDKSDIGLGNVDNVKQYSATNPPPYPVTSVNGATGDVKSTFYVTVTQGDNNTATADKTAEEVYAAYAAGYAVYAIVNLKPDIGYSLVAPMVIGFKQSNQVALAFITLSGFQFMEVQYIMSAWSVTIGTLANSDDIPTIPEYLPNPNALTFTGAVTGSYDGSAPLSVEIPSGGGGAEREWSMLADVDIAEIGGSTNIELTGLDNLTEFFIKWASPKNESTQDSAYVLYINGTQLGQIVPIVKASVNILYGYSYLRFNGLVWTIQKSAGAVSETNLSFTYQNAACPYNLPLGIGAATNIKLITPLASYQAVSGNIIIYGR